MVGLWAVSYTHLDVYKRQTGNITLGPGERLSVLSQDHFKWDAFTVMDTVMIDVYKRQSLYRLEEAGTVNGLDIHYRGNQLLKVTDDNKSFHGTYDFAIYPDLDDSEKEYYYDGNGNETANLDKNIVAVRYNILNLPDTVQFGDGNRIVNYYLSSGIKLGSISRTYTTPLSVPLDKITNSTCLLYTSRCV